MGESSDDAPDQAPGGGDGNRVRLLTIHAAKGLEAPVVFLADSAQGQRTNKPFHTLLEWPPEATQPESFILVGKKDQLPGAIQQRLEKEQQEQQRETANLLYVALTRARQLLFISGVRPSNRDESGWYFALRRALDPNDEIATDEPCILSHGEPSLPVNITPHPTTTEKPVVDPRLAQPLQVEPLLQEIAPSYQAGEKTFTAYEGDEDGCLRGLIIHRLLQLMSVKNAREWPEIFSQVAAEFDLEKDDALLAECCDECSALLKDSSLAPLFQDSDNTESLNEVPLIYRLGERTVHGIIDRLLVKGDEVWVIDYKSHRNADAQNTATLAAGFRQQLGYYADGVSRLWPEHRVRSFLLFTAPRLLQEVSGVEE